MTPHAAVAAAIVAARREMATEVLRATSGNVVRAAELLGVSHRTLCRWVAADPALGLALGAIRECKAAMQLCKVEAPRGA